MENIKITQALLYKDLYKKIEGYKNIKVERNVFVKKGIAKI